MNAAYRLEVSCLALLLGAGGTAAGPGQVQPTGPQPRPQWLWQALNAPPAAPLAPYGTGYGSRYGADDGAPSGGADARGEAGGNGGNGNGRGR